MINRCDSNMKILMILSKEFTIDPRVYKEAKSLIDAGHQVTVLMWDRKGESEKESKIEGIRVLRFRNTFSMNILPNDILRNPIWWRNAYTKGLKLFKNGFYFDVVHCHDLDTLQIGIWLKKKLKVKLIYDAHEIFGYMIENSVPKIVSKYSFRMEKRLLKYVDYIITVNEPLHDYFKSISDKPVSIVMNCNKLIIKEYVPTNNKIFIISYIGVLSSNRFFPQIIDKLAEIKDIKFVIAGRLENLDIYKQVEKSAIKYCNVTFLGTIPVNKVIPLTMESDCVLCPLDPSFKSHKVALANKQFDAMVCGKPIICTKGTYPGNLTEKLNCGLIVDYNLDAIKEAVVKLKDNPTLCEEFGRNGLEAAKKKYNWDIQKHIFLQLYKNLNQN